MKASRKLKSLFLSAGFFVIPFFPALAAPTGTVVICDDVADPATLDPHKQFTEKNHALLQQIYEGLVRFTPEGKVEPLLAVKWERLNPIVTRFFLREDVVFHNGEKFNSGVVAFSLGRYLDPKTGFPAAGFVASIASTTIVDDHTVDIHTHFPDGLLLQRLAGFILMVPPALAAKNEVTLSTSPVGTGPFRFASWKKGKEIVLARNDKYWKPNVPKVAELRFRFLPQERQIEELLQGRVDIVTELPGTYTLQVKQNPSTTILKKDTFQTVVGHFNTSQGALADKRVRIALNHAINKEELIRFDLLGNGRILASLTMPGEVGYNSTLVPYEYDKAKAMALLKEAGYPNGFEVQAVVRAQGERTAKILVKQLEAIGVRVNLKSVASDAEIIAAIMGGKWDMGFAALPDPMAHSFFNQSLLLYSKSPFSLNKDPEFDRRLEAMASELDPKKQAMLAQDLDKFVHDQALCLFTYQRTKTYGISKKVNFTPHITGMAYFDSLSLKTPTKN